MEDYDRWRKEPLRYQTYINIEKTLQDIKDLDEAIAALKDDKLRRLVKPKTKELPSPVLTNVGDLQSAVAEAAEPSSMEQRSNDDTPSTITDGDTITIFLTLAESGSAHPDGQGGTV